MNERLTVGQLIDILKKDDPAATVDFQITAFPQLDKQPENFRTFGIEKVMTTISPSNEPLQVLVRILTPAEHIRADRTFVAWKDIPKGGRFFENHDFES